MPCWSSPVAAYAELGVDIRLEVAVTGVDTRQRRVQLDDGTTVDYGRLVLATGACPRRLGIPGEELRGVHAYRTLDDAQAVRDAAQMTSRALVVGAGFIGMETAASLRARGLEVTLVEPGDGLFASLRAPAVSHSLARLYDERGVEVILGDTVASFDGSDGRLERAVLRSGRKVDAELAVVGVGVEPSTGYLDGSRHLSGARGGARRRAVRVERPGCLRGGRPRVLPRPRLRAPTPRPALDERELPG